MQMIQKSLLALAVLATTAVSAQAASNVDVKVIGRIDPGTCTPTLSGGGTVDYGTMSPSVLAATGYTVLPAKQLDFAIDCTAASKVAVQVVNGRPATLAGATEGAGGAGIAPSGVQLNETAGMGVIGLGKTGDVKVGGYSLVFTPADTKADGVAVDSIQANNNTTSWNKTLVGSPLSNNSLRSLSWATTGSLTPVAFTTLTGKLSVQPYLNQKSAFDLSNTVKMNGLATLELIYLP